MPFIEVKQGGIDIPDGVYSVTLTAISDARTVLAQRGVRAGQEVDLIDWTFAIDEGDFINQEITVSTSTASGPKSKMYAFLTALNNGKPPTVGQTYEKDDLIGLRTLATIHRDDQGWPRIENLSAMPVQMQQAKFAKATGAPTTAAAEKPLRQTVGAAAGGDDLPF